MIALKELLYELDLISNSATVTIKMNRDQTNLYLSCQMGDIKGITEAFVKNPQLVNECDKRVGFM